MRIQYSPEAVKDLEKLKEYIEKELLNPSAAERVIRRIMSSCSKLKEQPGMGLSLEKKVKRETDIRCLVSDNHLIFYRTNQDRIKIIRILDRRTDYIRRIETE